MSVRTRVVAGVSMAAALLGACGTETTTVYGAGDHVIAWTTPFADDGAVLIRLHGLPPGAVNVTTTERGSVVYSSRTADTLRIAVFGALVSGPLVRIGPLDASALTLVDVRVEEVATRGNEQRESPSGYSADIQRVR